MSLAALATGRSQGRIARPKVELRGRAVRLESPAGEKVWPRWMQVAGVGMYLGHSSGPFEFNEEVFDELIRNFRRLPEYKPGPDGVGTSRVIAYDWRHASEKDPVDGGANAIAAQAAQGWIWDIDKRKLADGSLGLFAFSEALEPARTLIDQEKIAWTSVCVWPDSVDQVTGEKIGCYLSSIAWTNDPFVRGMVPIQTQIVADAGRYVDFYDIPKTAPELVEALRALFGLAVQAPLADVLRELLTLRACASGQVPAPAGVDVVALVGALRRLFNLPTISTAAEVFAACDQLLGAVAAAEALEEATEPPSNKLPPLTAAARRAARTQKDTMETSALLALLAGHLKCAATPDAIAAHAPIYFAKAEATEKKGSGAETKLSAICAALGMDPENTAAAVDKIKSTMAAAKALEDAMPELAEMYEAEASAEDSDADEDMKVAADRLGSVPEGVRDDALKGLFFARTGGIELQSLKGPDGKIDHRPLFDAAKMVFDPAKLFSRLRARKTSKAKFREKLGAAPIEKPGARPPAHHSALFQRYAGQGDDAPARQQPDVARAGGARSFEAGRGQDTVIDLSDEGDLRDVGGNEVERALFVVRRDKLAAPGATFDQEHEAACRLAREWRMATSGASRAPTARF